MFEFANQFQLSFITSYAFAFCIVFSASLGFYYKLEGYVKFSWQVVMLNQVTIKHIEGSFQLTLALGKFYLAFTSHLVYFLLHF